MESEAASLSPEVIRRTLGKFGIEIPNFIAEQVLNYVDLLMRWNRKISLTSISDPVLVVERHFGESFFGAISVRMESGNLLDVGSGAGFPALPIAMLCPGLRVTLLEPNGKKAAFLAEASRKLGLLSRVRVERCRLEDFADSGKFTFVTSRAVRVTHRFLGRCTELLEPGGKLVLWLGENEIKIASENPGWIWDVPVKIPGSEQRYVIAGAPKSP